MPRRESFELDPPSPTAHQLTAHQPTGYYCERALNGHARERAERRLAQTRFFEAAPFHDASCQTQV